MFFHIFSYYNKKDLWLLINVIQLVMFVSLFMSNLSLYQKQYRVEILYADSVPMMILFMVTVTRSKSSAIHNANTTLKCT